MSALHSPPHARAPLCALQAFHRQMLETGSSLLFDGEYAVSSSSSAVTMVEQFSPRCRFFLLDVVELR
jgi:hypothetical protein